MDRSRRQDQEGYVLVTALIALAVMAILATATIAQANSALRMAAEAIRAEQALYMANAGVEHVLAQVATGQLITDGDRFADSRQLEPGLEGSYTARVTRSDDGVLQIRSTGRVLRGSLTATRVVEAEIAYPNTPPPPALVEVSGSVTLGNNAVICGDIRVGGDLNLGQNIKIATSECPVIAGTGKVTADGKITGDGTGLSDDWCEGGYDADGNACEKSHALPPTIPTPEPSTRAECLAQTDGSCEVIPTAPFTLLSLETTTPKTIYIDGGMTVGANRTPALLSGDITFVVAGDVTFREGLQCAPGESCSVKIFAERITDANHVEIWADLYATTAELKNGITVHGNLITREQLTVMNKLTVYGQVGSLGFVDIINNAEVWGRLVGGDVSIKGKLELYVLAEDGSDPGGEPGESGMPSYIRWQQ